MCTRGQFRLFLEGFNNNSISDFDQFYLSYRGLRLVNNSSIPN